MPLVLNKRNFSWITERISGVVEEPAPRWWWVAFAITSHGRVFGLFCLGYLISTGVGVWGLNHPVGWAWDITNFVFWIGIGHAGTLISAILFLLRQKWRTSINRAAEAMTLFAVICAGIFPGIHVGRVWMAWFLAPLPNNYGIWPNFRTPLLWDVFAVSTYFTVSVLFWYTGLIPDLATLRDRAKTEDQEIALRHLRARLARLEPPLAPLRNGLSAPGRPLHAAGALGALRRVLRLRHVDHPGWHTTIFPPYFVAGAIFGGFAMVLTLMIPARAIYKLQDIITPQHVDKMAKIILLTGSIVGYAYAMEFFVAWYSGNQYEKFAFYNRIFGPYWWYWWVGMMFCNVISPQLFWFKWFRAQHLRRLFRLHVRERRHVVRAFRHHRRRLAPRLPAFVLGHVLPDLGRDLDLRRHLRDLPLALPALHSLPADDRDVGSEDRPAGSRSASSSVAAADEHHRRSRARRTRSAH